MQSTAHTSGKSNDRREIREMSRETPPHSREVAHDQISTSNLPSTLFLNHDFQSTSYNLPDPTAPIGYGLFRGRSFDISPRRNSIEKVHTDGAA